MRIYIYPKDIQAISGKHITTACRKLNLIRAAYNKKSGQPVTIREFCEYEGISEDEIKQVIHQ